MKDLLRKIVPVGWLKMDIKDSFYCFWKGVNRSVHICYRKIWFVQKTETNNGDTWLVNIVVYFVKVKFCEFGRGENVNWKLFCKEKIIFIVLRRIFYMKDV